MSFFKFNPEDLINTEIVTFPKTQFFSSSVGATGSILLEKKYLDSTLQNRRYQGYSERLGGFVEKNGPFTASISMLQAVENGTNKEIYQSIVNLYNFYSLYNKEYIFNSSSVNLRVISIPEVYYEREILTGSFTGSDISGTTQRTFYDNGRGGIYSGSASGTLVGNIFYSEGLVVFTAPNLTASFGSGTVNYTFRGVNRVPVKIFRCRANAGELNCSTNPTYSRIKTNVGDSNRGEKEIIMPSNITYITKVGIYNDQYELVAVASLGSPIRKKEEDQILFRLKWDW